MQPELGAKLQKKNDMRKRARNFFEIYTIITPASTVALPQDA
jgi:hypothetical protein